MEHHKQYGRDELTEQVENLNMTNAIHDERIAGLPARIGQQAFAEVTHVGRYQLLTQGLKVIAIVAKTLSVGDPPHIVAAAHTNRPEPFS